MRRHDTNTEVRAQRGKLRQEAITIPDQELEKMLSIKERSRWDRRFHLSRG